MQTHLNLFEKQRAHQAELKLTSSDERVEKLLKMRQLLMQQKEHLKSVICSDFPKSPTEIEITEIYPCLAEIKHATKNLKRWMKRKPVPTPLSLFGTRSEIRYEPKGVVLIIGPWNYPFSLVIKPLIAAVAAGNCVIIKPSEITSHTSRFIKKFLGEIFDEKEVAVVEGDATVASSLLKLPFDHIFFTGSPAVGKLVMESAAKNLASVTLELGGKTPTVIHDCANLTQAAERLTFAKYVNAGQTCVAPDYVFVSENKRDEFVRELKRAVSKCYGANSELQLKSRDYCRIVNETHFDRLAAILKRSIQEGAQIEFGGELDRQCRYVSPTVLTQVSPDHSIMSEEIFGPILPVLSYRSLSEVYDFLHAQGNRKPLALYVFGKTPALIEETLKRTTSGGTCVNQALLHLANPNLPFGGMGQSGIGSYHGFHGFRAFSHERAVLTQGRMDSFKMFYPPYTDRVMRMVQRVTRIFT
jgi:aldehyde dehydrogenase (NAD+)